MCGIVGIINFNKEKVEPSDISIMLKTIKHRGPDDEGTFFHNNIALGHVRLSIIDLSSAGHQPMPSADERYCIVFNGEIYNYLELKNELQSKYQFRTKTDTEVLIAAYQEWGEECLSKLNGDFSFVIYDKKKHELFGARDRFGIKPFYYYQNSEQFAFASEIKALLPLIKNPSANNKILFDYLVYHRTDHTKATFFNNIFKLPHGHCFTIKNNELKIRKWYDLSGNIAYPKVLTPLEYREELKKSIALRLRSDVPIGVCLSGGIDSSTITSMLYHDFNLKNIKTFSAIFEKGSREDESPFIDQFKGTLRNMYKITPTAESFFDEFENFIYSNSEPVPGVSPYSQYKVMQLAHGNVSVTLDGQGADEMLGGYSNFYGAYFKELLKGFRLATLVHEALAYYQKTKSKEGFVFLAYFLMPLSFKNKLAKKRLGAVSPNFFTSYNTESTITSELYNPETLHISFLQHFEHKLEHLLKWDDLNSMRFSIESRIPFLDHHLVEKTLSLPPDLIIKNGVNKYILREAVKNILPENIYNRRDKKGLETPSDRWFRTKPFREYIFDLINSSSFKNRGYFDANDANLKFKLHIEGKANFSKDIWKWINLEIWFQQFIDIK